MVMYDLLVKGGRVIDPGQEMDGLFDVAVVGDRIAGVGKHLSERSRQVVDARNRVVTPGLIDMHCHVFDANGIGVPPDVAGVAQGVTTVVDGGSTGQANFNRFLKRNILASRTSVLCFLALCSRGVRRIPELRDWQDVDVEATAATIEANRDLIKGIKVRLVGRFMADSGLKVMEAAKKTARRFDLPVMIHIGDMRRQVPPAMTGEVLSLLDAGDILSHVFTARWGSVLRADGTVLPELLAAQKRGVVFDVGHGRANFSYAVASACMAQGVLPGVASSDLSARSLHGPVYGLTVTMSKLMALGMDLRQVVALATTNPARTLKIEQRVAGLRPGMNADISILEVLTGTWLLEDAEQQTLRARHLITPVMAVKAGQPVPAQPGAWPQAIP
ncbi:MAG: amidohydrolase/deacetylase family metallohydrolase [Chloroflexi bacterium]|nr:amidohydrolase/deacetylase family metallohydrolase [Chloroflexota bacterium]